MFQEPIGTWRNPGESSGGASVSLEYQTISALPLAERREASSPATASMPPPWLGK
jgi:hypothetical protein